MTSLWGVTLKLHLLKQNILLLVLIVAIHNVIAGEMIIENKLTEDKGSVITIQNKVQDANGNDCTLIKVISDLLPFEKIESPLFPVKIINKKSEVWIYLSPGEKRLYFSKSGYAKLVYDIPISTKSNKVYSMKIVGRGVDLSNALPVTLKIMPSDVNVIIDDSLSCDVSKPVMLEPKQYKIAISKSGYNTVNTIFVVSQDQVYFEYALDKESYTPDAMVCVEGGTFLMGLQTENEDGFSAKQHQVTLSSFYIGKYEITQKLWIELMGNNPSQYKGNELPVENVSWYEAIEFCNKLSVKVGLLPCYTIDKDRVDPNNENSMINNERTSIDDSLMWTISCNWSANGYRLPTEAEWEYAARGGRKSSNFIYSGSNDIGSVAWYEGNSLHPTFPKLCTHNVGTKQANELGIYDMCGNTFEWCWDWFNENYYDSSPILDPRGPVSGSSRIIRGGDFLNEGYHNTRRSSWGPTGDLYWARIGFRVSRSAK